MLREIEEREGASSDLVSAAAAVATRAGQEPGGEAEGELAQVRGEE